MQHNFSPIAVFRFSMKTSYFSKYKFTKTKGRGQFLTTLSPWSNFRGNHKKRAVESSQHPALTFYKQKHLFYDRKLLSFLSSRPFRLKSDFQIAKSCTGNKIFHFIQYKILGLGHRKGKIGSGWESNYSSVKALSLFSSYPILEQK